MDDAIDADDAGCSVVQVDPNAGTLVYVNTPGGGGLALDPGREVTARVIAAGGGAARISLAGQHVDVSTDATLRAGDTVRLSVTAADETGVRLAIVAPDGAAAGSAAQGRGAQILGELARAGLPVTPQLARAVEQVAAQLGGDAAATRAVANLAGRDLVLSPAGASRVAAALELAGTLGPSLASLASRSDAVAAALPTGVPSATALRTLLAPALAPVELAVARIAQALQSASGAAPAAVPTPPASSAAVIQNYVASQVALTASLDDIATAHLQAAPGASDSLARGQLVAGARPQGQEAGLVTSARAAALRGQDHAAGAALRTLLTPGAQSATGAATGAPAASAAANAHAAAASGAAAATPSPTAARTAAAIADLASLAVRFAPAVAGSTGAIGTNAQVAGRGINAVEVAQQAGPAGAAGAAAASVAGAGVGGDPVPLVHAMRAFLASPGSETDAARLLRGLGGADARALATAIGTLPESQALRLAGRLLELLPGMASQLGAGAAEQLRHGVHAALESLGRSFQPSLDAAGRELSTLRAALEHVAQHDARPTVAADAARLLAATDGQQILSRTAAGADPGYVYFQVPMPDGRGAEVMVRRDPARRAISFDEFNIAFLLTTERLGTLMIQLEAHAAGIRADVRTDVPALEPFLRARGELLVEPLAAEARRPVIVTTGVFEQDPPASLLEPQLGLVQPGTTEFYA